MKLLPLLLPLLLASSLFAPLFAQPGQPGLPLAQITTPPSTGLALFTSLNGRLVPVVMGANVRLEIVNGRPTLLVTVPVPPPPVVPVRSYEVVVTPAMLAFNSATARTFFTPPAALNADLNTVTIWLNGLRLRKGADYELTATGLLFISAYGDMTLSPNDPGNPFQAGLDNNFIFDYTTR